MNENLEKEKERWDQPEYGERKGEVGSVRKHSEKGRKMDYLLDKIMSDKVQRRAGEAGGEESGGPALGMLLVLFLSMKISPHSSH